MQDNEDSVRLVHQKFDRLLNAVGSQLASVDHLGEERIDSIRGSIAAREEAVAFDELITSLDEYDVDVPSEFRDDLRFLADAFGMLDHRAVSGKYW